MDSFLKQQEAGKVVDSSKSFTINRALSREKVLESIPRGPSTAVFRLLDAASEAWGFSSSDTLFRVMSNQRNNSEAQVLARFPEATPAMKARLLDELRRPFGDWSGASLLARAIFRAVQLGARVSVNWSDNVLTSALGLSSGLVLDKGQLNLPESVETGSWKGLFIYIFPASIVGELSSHRTSLARTVYRSCKHPERLLPLEAASNSVKGYFDYRTKPFTPIRSYAFLDSNSDEEGMLVDVWDGPYSSVDDSTVLLDTKKPGKFLFFRWRANYGRPTFLHHSLDSDFAFGEQKCKATFWVETTDSGANVQFYSKGVVSDSVSVKGPPGLVGLVMWPGLTFDLWGTALVRNEEYERAFTWAQARVDRTAQCLRENLDEVTIRLERSSLIKPR